MKTCPILQPDLVGSRIAYGRGYLAAEDSDLCRRRWSPAPREPTMPPAMGKFTLSAWPQCMPVVKVEMALGATLRRSPGWRDWLVMQTKCGAVDSPKGALPPDIPFRYDVSFDGIVASAKASLERLGTDRQDILLLHSPDLLARPEGVGQVSDEFHRAGKVRYFGVSKLTASQIDLLRKYLQ